MPLNKNKNPRQKRGLFVFRQYMDLNQDGRDWRIDQDHGINQDGRDWRMDQDHGINQDGRDWIHQDHGMN